VAKDWDSDKGSYALRGAQQLAIQVNKLHGKLKRDTKIGMSNDSLLGMCENIGKFAEEVIEKLSPDDVRNRKLSKMTDKENIAPNGGDLSTATKERAKNNAAIQPVEKSLTVEGHRATYDLKDPLKTIPDVKTAKEAFRIIAGLNAELRKKIVLKPSGKTTLAEFYERFTTMTLAQQAAYVNKASELFAKIPLPNENPGFYAAANCPLDERINLMKELNFALELLQRVPGFNKHLFLPNSKEEQKIAVPSVQDKLSSRCSPELAAKIANSVAKNRIIAFTLAKECRDIFPAECFNDLELDHTRFKDFCSDSLRSSINPKTINKQKRLLDYRNKYGARGTKCLTTVANWWIPTVQRIKFGLIF
jgi:hypothetical protein